MLPFCKPRCAVCGKAFESNPQEKREKICASCRTILEARANSPAFKQGFEFATYRKPAAGCSGGLILLLFATLCFSVSLIAVLFAPSPRPVPSQASSPGPKPAAPTPAVAAPQPPPAAAPPAPIRARPIILPQIPYRLLKRSEPDASTLQFDVEVPLIDRQLPTQQQLATLVTRLAGQERRDERLVVAFYLPGMILGAGGFATGRLDSQLTIDFVLNNLRSYPQYQRFLPTSAVPKIYPTEIRRWRCADGRELNGRVIDLDMNQRTVTLVLENGQRMENLPLNRLHPDDQALILRLRR